MLLRSISTLRFSNEFCKVEAARPTRSLISALQRGDIPAGTPRQASAGMCSDQRRGWYRYFSRHQGGVPVSTNLFIGCSADQPMQAADVASSLMRGYWCYVLPRAGSPRIAGRRSNRSGRKKTGAGS